VSSRRQQQFADFIRDEVSQILMYEMKDPRLGLVSITRVEMSPDLRYARVFVSVYGDEEKRQETLQALTGASGFIRRLLAPRVHARHIPEVSFRIDRSMEHAEAISRTLQNLDDIGSDDQTETASDDSEGRE
jgi:ribosome-binding factor A